MEFDIVNYLLLPLLIFATRIVDVSIGTLRVIFVAKGLKYLAPILGFFEVFIWIIVVGKLMSGKTDMIIYVAYAAGFAAGNYVGMILEEKLAFGKVLIRVIMQKKATSIITKFRELDYPATIVNGEGKNGKVKVAFSIIKKKDLPKIKAAIHEINPKAFYTIEDIRYTNEVGSEMRKSKFDFLKIRKSK